MAKKTKSSHGCGCADGSTATPCVVCDINQMARNHYFTGKLLVERDFTDEQLYHMGKVRRHNKFLHGMGVTCGLQIVQHPNVECRPQYVVIEPGTAVDCCGREIWVEYEQFLDVRALFEAWWRAQHGDETPPDDQQRDFAVCLSYAECFTEEIPALFDDCGCDDTAGQPNRVQETFELGIRPWQDPDPGSGGPPGDPIEVMKRCWTKTHAGQVDDCHTCDDGCVPLAVIRDYVYGQPIEDANSPNPPVWIDNGIRPLLPSTSALYALLQCLYTAVAQLQPGIEDLQVSFVPCDQPQAAEIKDVAGVQTLVLTLHDPCASGIEDLQVSFVPCDQPQAAEIKDVAGVPTLALTLHDTCTQSNGIDRVVVGDCADCQAGEAPSASISTDPDGNRILTLSFPCCQEPGTVLERVEPYVSGISWEHAGVVDPNLYAKYGLLVAFRGLVRQSDLNAHTLQVLIENPGATQFDVPVVCWCEMPGTISGVILNVIDQGDGSDQIVDVVDPSPADPFVNGVRWQPPGGVDLPSQLTYRVVVKGDLIMGENGQSVDGNHLAPWLPKRASGDGLPGGTFESWFSFTQRVSVNRATAAELAAVPGIGSELAGAIVAHRTNVGRFGTLESLTAVSGIANKKLAALRPHLRL